jgi:hypothetical protein
MVGNHLADLVDSNQVANVVDLLLDSLDGVGKVLDRCLKCQRDRSRLERHEVSAGSHRLPVEVASRARAVVHHAPEEAVARGDRSVLAQQLHCTRGQFDERRPVTAEPLRGVERRLDRGDDRYRFCRAMMLSGAAIAMSSQRSSCGSATVIGLTSQLS